MIKIVVEFILIFILCYFLYLIFVILNKKNNKFKARKPRMEDALLMTKFKIDFKKINYKKYLHLIALTNSFILALTVELVKIFKGIFFQILLSIIVLIPLIILAYTIIGKYYQKKGMVKDV